MPKMTKGTKSERKPSTTDNNKVEKGALGKNPATEGGEYINVHPNKKLKTDRAGDNADYDKIKGNK